MKVPSESSFVEIVAPVSNEVEALQRVVESVPADLLVGRAHEAIALAEILGSREYLQLRRIADRLGNLLNHTGSTGVLVVDLNDVLPDELDRLPPTPDAFADPRDHRLTRFDLARCALIGAAGGYSYAYRDQGGGNLCDDVMPKKDKADDSTISYGIKVGWHTEDAPYHRADDRNLHPVFDILSLAYLRNPHRDPTLVSMPQASQIASEILDELRKPQFTILTSDAQGGDNNTILTPTSFIYSEHYWIRFTFAKLEKQRATYEQRGLIPVIDAFINHLDAHASFIEGKPGTVAFVDNMRVAHARGEMNQAPKYDGTDRWHRRVGLAVPTRRPFLESLMRDASTRIIDNRLLLRHSTELQEGN